MAVPMGTTLWLRWCGSPSVVGSLPASPSPTSSLAPSAPATSAPSTPADITAKINNYCSSPFALNSHVKVITGCVFTSSREHVPVSVLRKPLSLPPLISDGKIISVENYSNVPVEMFHPVDGNGVQFYSNDKKGRVVAA